MAFRASSVVPSEALRITKGAAVQLKQNLSSFIATLSAQSVGFAELRGIYRTLERADAQFASLSATPGLAAYAQAQEDDATYDVAAEFTAMRSAVQSAIGWIGSNVPTTATVAPIGEWTDQTVTSNAFTPAQTAGLRAALQVVVDSID